NADYWDDLKGSIDIIKNNSVSDSLINRFVKLAPKLQNTGVIIKEVYDYIFGLEGYVFTSSLSQVIADLPEISGKSVQAKIYFFELLSKPENIKKLDLERCGQIMNILPNIGNDELAKQIDINLKEHLKNELHKNFSPGNYRLSSDAFMGTLMKLSTQSEN